MLPYIRGRFSHFETTSKQGAVIPAKAGILFSRQR